MAKFLTKVTIEKSEQYIVRFRRRFLRAYCSQCNREVGMISPDIAALLSGNNLETIDFLMQKEQFHLHNLSTGKSFICINSLCSIK